MPHDSDNPRPEDIEAAKARDAASGAGRGESKEPAKEWDISDADFSDFSAEVVRTDETVARLEKEVLEERTRAMRLMADFQNFQRRAATNERVARAQGVSSVVTSVVPVIDHFDLALAQDTSKASAQQIVDGVKVIREELLRVLTRHGVQVVSPTPNDEFVPGRHEAIMQMPVEGVASGHIAQTFQPGFVLREGEQEFVLRPAKVAVAP
jgi:molecular chaperone GrpE